MAAHELDAATKAELATALRFLASDDAGLAVPLLEAAHERFEGKDPVLAAEIASHLSQAYVATGRRTMALELLGQAAEGVRSSGLEEIRSRILMLAAPLHPSPDAGVKLAAEADRLASAWADPRPRLYTMTTLFEQLQRAGHDEPLLPLARFMSIQAKLCGDQAFATQAAVLEAELLQIQNDSGALVQARSAHAQTLLLGDPHWRARAAWTRGLAARQQGDFLEALECFDQVSADRGHSDDELRLERAMACAQLGVEAEQTAKTLEAVSTCPDPALSRRALLALANWTLDGGQLEAAEHWLGQLTATADQQAVRARLHLARGEGQKALQLLEVLESSAPTSPGLTLLHAEALAAAGGLTQALRLLDALVRSAQSQDRWLLLRALLQRAAVWTAQGATDQARLDARQAADIAEEMHLPVHHARARALVALALARQDLTEEAISEIVAAADMAQRLGATGESTRLLLLQALVEPADRAAWQGAALTATLEAAQALVDPRLLSVVLMALAAQAWDGEGDADAANALVSFASTLDGQIGNRLSNAIAALRARIATANQSEVH